MFNLIRRTPLEEYNGEGLFYIHQKTGMEVFHIKNKDPELTCSFIFSTPSEDDKGVAHILEHTVLSGSERFPVKDPFSLIQQSSPNTFLNAVTFGDKTMFPLSSPLKKDFDNLFDLYADSVFAPLLRKNSFYQEGIRLFDGKPDGVVYNEMSGSSDNEDSILQNGLCRALFEGTPYQYVSGGDPQAIITLSYEEYLARYKKWYSPTNCKLFLFGDLETKEYLDKLEERYLKKAERGECFIPKSEYYMQPQLKIMEKVASCPSKEASSVVLSWLTTPSSDPLEVLTLSILVDILLGNPGAPLYKAIVESDLGEDLNPMSGTNPDCPVLTFTVGFTGAKPNKEKEIEAFLIETIAKYVKEGLPKDDVDAVVKRNEYKLQEIPEGAIPFGLGTCLKAARTWLRGKTPEEGIRDFQRLEKFKKLMESGHYLEDWMQKNLLDNPRRVLFSTVYDPNYNNRAKEVESKMVNKMPIPSQQEKQAFEDFVNTPDSPEAIATIGHITRADIIPSSPNFRHKVYRSEKGAKLYVLPLFTRSIVILKFYFDVRNLNEEEHKLLPVLTRLLNMCGTSKHSFSEIGTALKMTTGGFSINLENGRVYDSYKPLSGVLLKTKLLRCDLSKALDLIDEILLDANLEDYSKIKAVLTDILTDYKNNYTYNASSYASLSAASVLSATAMESEFSMGTQRWFYVQELKNNVDENPKAMRALSVRLTKLYKKVFTQKAMFVHMGCEEPTSECEQLVLEHMNKYPEGKFVRIANFYDKYQSQVKKEIKLSKCFEVSSGPAFNAIAIGLKDLTNREKISALLLGELMTSGYLWNTVRGKNGAYGVACSYDELEGMMMFSSYRDPCIEKTYEAFLEALESSFSNEEIEYGIVSALSRDILLPYPQMRCQIAYKMLLGRTSWHKHVERMEILKTITKEDLEAVAKKIRKCAERQLVQVTVCGKEMLQSPDSHMEFSQCVELPI